MKIDHVGGDTSPHTFALLRFADAESTMPRDENVELYVTLTPTGYEELDIISTGVKPKRKSKRINKKQKIRRF